MTNLHSRRIYGNLVYYDTTFQRLIDAIGPDVVKFILNTAYLPLDDTTSDPTGFTTTTVDGGTDGNGSVTLVDNSLRILTDDAENDGANVQVKGEAFDLAANNYVYFGINFKINDVTQSDLLVGLCITNTNLLGGMTDGIYFESLDGSAAVALVLEKDSTETTVSSIGTLADDTNITLEFLFDGTNVDSWVNGVVQTRPALTNLPNNEQLTPSIHFLTGEGAAQTLTVNWLRVIQVNA